MDLNIRLYTCLLCVLGAFILEMNIVHANHGSAQNCSGIQDMVGAIGGVLEQSSRIGREQKIAMEMAIHDFCKINNICSCPVLHLKDSQGNPARSFYQGMQD